MFKNTVHKSKLINALSDCFDPLRSDLGNVHPHMRESRYITGSILGICKAYALTHHLSENTFNLLVDAAFEEIFRRESITVQDRAEQWLNTEDDEFMQAYYQAKKHTDSPLELDWLTDYAEKHFRKARTLHHPL